MGSTRTLYHQSAVVPFRRRGHGLEILLVTSRSGKRWVIPKGLVEPDLTASASAVKEAYEEAGIKGKLRSDCLGTYEYEKWGGTCEVEVFLFEVQVELDDWPEADERERRWMSLTQAIDHLDEPGLQDLLRAVPDQLS